VSSNGPTAYDRILDRLEGVRRNGDHNAIARCPAHDDRNPSLSLRAIEGQTLVYCHAGCAIRDVLAAIEMTTGELFDEPKGATYRYDDGRFVYRSPDKDFKQSGNTSGPSTLYRLAKVTEVGKSGETILLVEGEKDVHALESIGVVATTAPMGARNFHKVDARPLYGAKVIAVVDKDDQGREWARQVFAELDGRAASLEFREARAGKDAADHIAAGFGLDDLVDMESEAHKAARERFPRLDIAALLSAERPAREWLWWRLIPVGAAVAVVAPAGTGKSLLVLALMVAVARGDRAFAGLRITNRRVFLVDMENTEDDLAERFRDLGVDAGEVEKLDNLVFIHLPKMAALDTPAGGSELEAALDAYDIHAGDVVVLDSTQRVLAGKENDSDTIRAYYLCTGIRLKRRGITVIRTDNTGKDLDRGARGTSGKRDDVDVELFMTMDSGKISIKPGKIRLPDVESITIEKQIADDGRIYYDTARDPYRAKINDAIAALDRHQIPLDTGMARCYDLLKGLGEEITREALRAAIKERRHLAKTAQT